MHCFLGGEVPATKLAALQKVLQSEFLNAVREVYEHIYETVEVIFLGTKFHESSTTRLKLAVTKIIS